MVSGIIYCATLPSNKKYYGFSLNLENRKRTHKCHVNARTKNKFYNAIRKYGWNNIIWEIIEKHDAECKKDLKEILCNREMYWIAKSNTFLDGYNMTEGGDGALGLLWKENSKEKLSETQRGRKLSDSHKKNIGLGLIGKSNGMKDKHHDEKTKHNISKKLEGIKRSKETKDKMGKSKIGKNNPMYGKIPWNKKIDKNESKIC